MSYISALGSTKSPIQWAPGALFPRAKRPVRQADHSLSSSVEVKNGGAIPPFPNTSSWRVAWLIKHRLSLLLPGEFFIKLMLWVVILLSTPLVDAEGGEQTCAPSVRAVSRINYEKHNFISGGGRWSRLFFAISNIQSNITQAEKKSIQ
jgi:hypothetical protein